MFNKLPKRLSKKQMIEDMIEDVWNWDLDNLIGFVQESIRSRLEKASKAEVKEEYKWTFALGED